VPTVEEVEEKVNQLRGGGNPIDGCLSSTSTVSGPLKKVENVIRAKRGAFNFVNYPKRKWDLSKPIPYYMDTGLSE
jgi:hypothetical protein